MRRARARVKPTRHRWNSNAIDQHIDRCRWNEGIARCGVASDDDDVARELATRRGRRAAARATSSDARWASRANAHMVRVHEESDDDDDDDDGGGGDGERRDGARASASSIDEAFARLKPFSVGANGGKPARSFRRGGAGGGAGGGASAGASGGARGTSTSSSSPRANESSRARASWSSFASTMPEIPAGGVYAGSFSGVISPDGVVTETSEPARAPPVFQFSAIPTKTSPSPMKRTPSGRGRSERPRAMRDLNAQFERGAPAAAAAAETTARVVEETPAEDMEIPSPEPSSPEPMAVETPDEAPHSNASSTFDFTPKLTGFNIGQSGSSGGSKKSAAFTKRASMRVEVQSRVASDTPDSTTSAASSFGPASPRSPMLETPVPEQFSFSPIPQKSSSKAPASAPTTSGIPPTTFNIGQDDSPSLGKHGKSSRSFKFAQRASGKGEKKPNSSATSPTASTSTAATVPTAAAVADISAATAKMSVEADINPAALKLQGNLYFRDGRYAEAEALYSRAILHFAAAPRTNVAPASGEASPLGVEIDTFTGREAAVLLTNRAAATMMIATHQCTRSVMYNELILRALTDCERAMRADETFSRARSRTAACHMLFGNFQAALEVVEHRLADSDGEAQKTKLQARACVEHMKVINAALPAMRSGAPGLPRLYMDKYSPPLDMQTMPWVTSIQAIQTAVPSIRLANGVGEVFNEARALTMIMIGSYTEARMFADEVVAMLPKAPVWLPKFRFMAMLGRGELEDAMLEASAFVREQGPGSDVVDEDFQALMSMAEAMLKHKEEGNKLFNAKNYAEAITAYTNAFEASTSALGAAYCSIVLGNRAAANQGLNEVFDALADCGRALSFNPWNFKALSRRSTMHEQLRCWDEAVKDMEKYVELLTNIQTLVTPAEREKALPAGTKRLRSLQSKARLPNRPQIDAYAVLGLSALKMNATESDIKKAYRTLALKYHPDKANRKMPAWAPADALHDDADRLFKLLGEMNGQLSDTALRRVYDETERLREYQRSSSFTQSNTWSSHDFQYGANFSPFTSPRRSSRSRSFNDRAPNNHYWKF